MSKNAQSAILSNWFGIDRVLFGENSPQDLMEASEYESYISSKGALLSNLYEIYVRAGYNPSKKFENLQELALYGMKMGDKSRKLSKEMIMNESLSESVRNEMIQVSISEGVDVGMVSTGIVDRKVKELALDNLLIAKSLKEGCSKCLDNWQGKVLVDAHRTLRNSLIEQSYKK